jgi:carbon monoxide dehydrogenase subunit G
MDIPWISTCVPGAKLTEIIDENIYRGKIAVRLGPVALSFGGIVTLSEINGKARTASIKADGNEAKGRGSAGAITKMSIEPEDGKSRVILDTTLMLSGTVAQYGRSVSVVQAAANSLIDQFSNNLKARLEQAEAPAEGHEVTDRLEAPSAAPPISFLTLFWAILKSQIARLFGNRSGSSI